jgi:FkbM family methyltransferase
MNIVYAINKFFFKKKDNNSTNKPSLIHPFTKLPLIREEVKLVVDVGAFEGYYALAAAQSYPNAKIIAIEPSLKNKNILETNVEKHAGRVKVVHSAVSDSPGIGVLNITSTGAANSLYQQTAEHSRQNPHVTQIYTEQVSMMTLDALMAEHNHADTEQIDVLKIDVEGAEINVLRGGLESLKRTRFAIIEVSLARDSSIENQMVFQVFEVMNKNKFSLYSIIDPYPFEKPEAHLGMAQFDVIFKNTLFE